MSIFSIKHNQITFYPASTILLMIINKNTSNAYVLKEEYADMMLGHLAQNNMGHLFHKLDESIGLKFYNF